MALGRSHQSITDDEKARFLLELILTNSWSDEFENLHVDVFEHRIPSDRPLYHIVSFSTYMQKLGLIKWSEGHISVIEISERGIQFLNRYKGEKHEQ